MKVEELKTLSEHAHQAGYDREAEYFQQRNREWIAEQEREREQSKRSQEMAARRREHWRKCPECGADLAATEVGGHHGLICVECQSVTLPLAEIAGVLKAAEPHTWVEGFKAWLVQSLKPHPTGLHHIPV